MAQLQILWLNDNALRGSIPSELGNLLNLILLNVSSNALSGTVPSELTSKFLPSTEIYLFNNNALSGDVSLSMILWKM